MPFHRRLACKLNYFQSIILMFAAVILIGAALLMLPISAQERTVTPFHEALFTATSAVCVTGLVVRDTGFSLVSVRSGRVDGADPNRRLGCDHSRRVFLAFIRSAHFPVPARADAGAMSAPKVGGIVRLTGFVIRTSLMIEGIGALCMLPVFCRDFGVPGYGKPFFIPSPLSAMRA